MSCSEDAALVISQGFAPGLTQFSVFIDTLVQRKIKTLYIVVLGSTLDNRLRIHNDFDLTRLERQPGVRKMKFSKDKYKVFYGGRQNKLVITKLGIKWLRLEHATDCFWLTKVTLWVKKGRKNLNQRCN